MVRINLINDLSKSGAVATHIPLPRLFLALVSAFVALALWACSSTDFSGTAPANPNPQPEQHSEQNPSPLEEGKAENAGPANKGETPTDPKRSLALQITGIQPEAWWNNCLKVELGGKSFNIACTKDINVTGKVVRIPVPEGVSCPVLNLKVESFKNTGSTCAERTLKSQTCNGPFEATPSFVRSHATAADRVNFVLTDVSQASGGRLVRVYFEDQSAESINKAKADPNSAVDLGIDFNDAIFDIKTLEMPFEIQGAPSTKCP